MLQRTVGWHWNSLPMWLTCCLRISQQKIFDIIPCIACEVSYLAYCMRLSLSNFGILNKALGCLVWGTVYLGLSPYDCALLLIMPSVIKIGGVVRLFCL